MRQIINTSSLLSNKQFELFEAKNRLLNYTDNVFDIVNDVSEEYEWLNGCCVKVKDNFVAVAANNAKLRGKNIVPVTVTSISTLRSCMDYQDIIVNGCESDRVLRFEISSWSKGSTIYTNRHLRVSYGMLDANGSYIGSRAPDINIVNASDNVLILDGNHKGANGKFMSTDVLGVENENLEEVADLIIGVSRKIDYENGDREKMLGSDFMSLRVTSYNFNEDLIGRIDVQITVYKDNYNETLDVDDIGHSFFIPCDYDVTKLNRLYDILMNSEVNNK